MHTAAGHYANTETNFDTEFETYDFIEAEHLGIGCALTSSPLKTGGLLHLRLLFEMSVSWKALCCARIVLF